MSPESTDYLGVAEKQLFDAERALNSELHEAAARSSYMAALSAARAVIFEKTGNAPKTHSGARAQLGNLKNSGIAIHVSFVPYLAKGYETKSDLDYGPYTPVPKEVAESAVAVARELVGWARDMLARSD